MVLPKTPGKEEQESGAVRFERCYCPIVLALALVMGLVLPAFRGGWVRHLQKAAVLLRLALMEDATQEALEKLFLEY